MSLLLLRQDSLVGDRNTHTYTQSIENIIFYFSFHNHFVFHILVYISLYLSLLKQTRFLIHEAHTHTHAHKQTSTHTHILGNAGTTDVLA